MLGTQQYKMARLAHSEPKVEADMSLDSDGPDGQGWDEWKFRRGCETREAS